MPLSVEVYDLLTDMGELDKHTELIRGVLIEKTSKSRSTATW